MRHAKLSAEMRSRVLDYLDYCWAASKGLDEAEVIATLPPTLQAEIRAATNQQLIQKVPLFDGCDEHTRMAKVRSWLALGEAMAGHQRLL